MSLVVSLKRRQNKQSFHTCQQGEIYLQNITPIDGRYKLQLTSLTYYFSEFAYIKNRIQVEIEYLLFLSKNKVAPQLTQKQITAFRSLYLDFSLEQAGEVKRIEQEINHDMKAIEYFLQRACKQMKLERFIPYIHWGITSDDTGNLAYGIALNQYNIQEVIPTLNTVLTVLKQIVVQNKKSYLLARTHGQPAVPTTFGKELANFYARLNKQFKIVKNYSFEGKLMGAVGNLNAHKMHFPSVDWVAQSKVFVRSLGLVPNIHTTQILPYDNWVTYFQTLHTINGILVGLSRDIWTYIMLEEVKLKKKEEEVGSSTMPQKVNPIDFENAEGNCEVANAYFQMYERKLLQSRLQRDLSDSVVKRTIGTALAHTILAWNSMQKGLKKIEFDTKTALQHLSNHYEVLSEAIQTQLRLMNDEEGYEKVKKMTRGKKITRQLFQEIIHTLKLTSFEAISPEHYLGYAEELAKEASL